MCADCGYRFTSYEHIERKPIVVIKKDGRHQTFDIGKVQRGIRTCTEKLPIGQTEIDKILRAIEDDGTYTLNFKTNEYIFGGGRLQGITTKEIPSDWNDVCRIYDEAIGKVSERNDYKVEYNEDTKELTIEPTEPEKAEIETEKKEGVG